MRTKKVVTGGATTHYVYGAGGLLSGEYDNTGGLIREYVYHYGEPVAQIDAGVSETLIYLHTDHLGTPRKGSNASGSNVWSWDSDAFGVGAPTGSAEVNLRFAGQYFDAESDLHYNWNRYYNPATGRYVSSDPIGLAGGINTYGYSLANPVMYLDPKGLNPQVWIYTNPTCASATKAQTKDPNHRCYGQGGHAVASRVKPRGNCDVIVAHAKPGVAEDQSDPKEKKQLDLEGAIDRTLEANPDFQCLDLVMCQGGEIPLEGGPSLQEQAKGILAEKGHPDAPVNATKGSAVVFPDGTYKEGVIEGITPRKGPFPGDPE